MKKTALLVVLLFLSLTGWSQCPALVRNTTHFNTQADIAAFKANYPNCTAITGILSISGSDITDLSDLSQITSVGRGLIFKANWFDYLTSAWGDIPYSRALKA